MQERFTDAISFAGAVRVASRREGNRIRYVMKETKSPKALTHQGLRICFLGAPHERDAFVMKERNTPGGLVGVKHLGDLLSTLFQNVSTQMLHPVPTKRVS